MTGVRSARLVITIAATLALVSPPRLVAAHPLHTTITELTEDRARGTVRAVIRVFADDFGTVVARRTRGAPISEATAFAYVSSTFSFTDRAGRMLSVQSCGMRRTADLVWVCVEARSPAGLAPLSVRNAVMCDLFDDQVNVVQGSVGGARRSLLLTRGDRAKPLT